MAENLEELPLFPLQTVLFPYATMQLHVHEERYREMVKLCIEFDRPFGIVLIRDQADASAVEADPYLVGTAVRIDRVHTYDDGRMDLQVHGERRFRIRRISDERAYLVGWVEPVVEAEAEDSPRAYALLCRAKEGLQLLISRLLAHPSFTVDVRYPSDPVVLSFRIASLLQLENREKQGLLETTDTLDRLARLIPLLERQLEEVERSVRASHTWRLRPADMQEWIHTN